MEWTNGDVYIFNFFIWFALLHLKILLFLLEALSDLLNLSILKGQCQRGIAKENMKKEEYDKKKREKHDDGKDLDIVAKRRRKGRVKERNLEEYDRKG